MPITLKPTISFQDQIALLEDRKLIIKDKEYALQYLQNNSYYHLNIYFRQNQFETGILNKDGEPLVEFYPGTTFEHIVRIHENDSRLRGFVMQLLQPIEIRLRTAISYHLGQRFGSEIFYLDSVYSDISKINSLRRRFNDNIEKDTGNPIVSHHIHKYQKKFPLFAILELSTFGFLKNYFNFLDISITDEIAIVYLRQQNARNLKNWMSCLCDLRNICAHHNYLHGRLFDATPVFLDDQILEGGQRKTLFAYFVVMGYLSAPNFWKEVLDELEQYNIKTDCLQGSSYGFGKDWKKKLIEGVIHF